MTKKLKLTAKTANKYDLYEQSVQNVDFEVEFISKTFKKYNKSECTTLREDFCASAKISSAWVKSNPRTISYAIFVPSQNVFTLKSLSNFDIFSI